MTYDDEFSEFDFAVGELDFAIVEADLLTSNVLLLISECANYSRTRYHILICWFWLRLLNRFYYFLRFDKLLRLDVVISHN